MQFFFSNPKSIFFFFNFIVSNISSTTKHYPLPNQNQNLVIEHTAAKEGITKALYFLTLSNQSYANQTIYSVYNQNGTKKIGILRRAKGST